eukprot:TRINITY_DN3014_c0_g2_i1.p2 TRINITY_DN3014_c0_g2~~TRINITY_DN3014_c0_g2_i1.p2  ORF type:complete len:122 (-),score=17.01 TRINITY_DN3014_c0_g2_i1:26-391(-)
MTALKIIQEQFKSTQSLLSPYKSKAILLQKDNDSLKVLLKCKERELAACEKNLLAYKKEFCELMKTVVQKNAGIKTLTAHAKPLKEQHKENILHNNDESIAASVKHVNLSLIHISEPTRPY